MKQTNKALKIIVLFFAIVGIALLTVAIVILNIEKPVATLSEDEIKQFSNYITFDGNLYCIDAEEYLGTLCSEIDYYYMIQANQNLYKIKGVDLTNAVLSYTCGAGMFAKDSITIVFHQDSPNPIFDWEIESVEICDAYVSYNIDRNNDPIGYKAIMSYSEEQFEATRNKEVFLIDDQDTIDLFIKSLKINYNSSADVISYGLKERILNSGNSGFKIKVSFKNARSLVWMAPIFVDDTDGQIYLLLNKPDDKSKGIAYDSYLIPISLDIDYDKFK